MRNDEPVTRPASRQRRGEEAEVVFQGKLFQVWQWQQELFDGSVTTFEQLSRPDTVLVLPITTSGEALFLEESQPGTAPMFRTIGGRVEPGEAPEMAALRELREESGYETGELRLWAAWQPINKIDWAVYLFVAHRLSAPVELNLDAGEKVTLRSILASELLDAPSAPALDDNEFLYQLNFARSDADERRRVEALLHN